VGNTSLITAFKDVEEIVAWQRAIDLSAAIHLKFKDHKDFAFRDQIHRAAISVSKQLRRGVRPRFEHGVQTLSAHRTKFL